MGLFRRLFGEKVAWSILFDAIEKWNIEEVKDYIEKWGNIDQ